MKREQERPKLLWVGPISVIGGITVITKRFLKDPQVHARYQVKVQDQGFFGRWNQVDWLRPFKIPLGIFKTLWNVVAFRPTIVHMHTSYDKGFLRDALIALTAHAFRCKVVMTFHSGAQGSLINIYNNGSRWLQKLTQFTLPRMDALVANGATYKEFLEQEFGHTNIYVIANPVDDDFVASVTNPYTEREKPVFFAGFLDTRKGAFDLLKAAELVPGAQFVIYGTAPEMEPFRRALAQCKAKDRIVLDEGYGVEKVIYYMNRARVLALPSYGETLPLIMEEAIASGVPVIVTPVGVIGDYVQDGVHGHMITPGDIRGLAHAIIHILEDEAWAERVAASNRIYGRQFLSSQVNREMLDMYDAIWKRVDGH